MKAKQNGEVRYLKEKTVKLEKLSQWEAGY